MNRKVNKDTGKERTIAPVAAHSFYDTPEGERLKSITPQIEKYVIEEWKKLAASERAKMPAIFRDEGLWQKREAWIIASRCLKLILDGKAAEQVGIEMLPVDEHTARGHFEFKTGQAGHTYMLALAEKLKAVVRQSTEAMEERRNVNLSYYESSRLPPELEGFDELMVIDQACGHFERYCWPGFPEPEKELLRSYLLRGYHLKAADLQALFKTLSEDERKVVRSAWADLQGLSPEKLYELVNKMEMLTEIEKSIKEHRSRLGVKKKKEAYKSYVELQDKLLSEGKDADYRTIIRLMKKQRVLKDEGISDEVYDKVRQGMNRYRKDHDLPSFTEMKKKCGTVRPQKNNKS